MKRFLSGLFVLFLVSNLSAQTFTATSDTVRVDYGYPQLEVRDDLVFIDENNNNIIDRDEAVVISFTVYNAGKYPAKNVSIIPQELNSITGLQFPAEMEVGDILPGSSRQIQVGIAAAPNLERGTANFTFFLLENGEYDNLSIVYAVGTAQGR